MGKKTNQLSILPQNANPRPFTSSKRKMKDGSFEMR